MIFRALNWLREHCPWWPKDIGGENHPDEDNSGIH